MNWDYFDRFEEVNAKYLPDYGEGETLATQVATAVNKLIYKWFNDGDVYDNRYFISGWCNDLSSYANWLDCYTEAGAILERIKTAYTDEDYEAILKDLADKLLDDEYLEEMNHESKVGSVYKCKGEYEFEEYDEDEEEDW